MTTDEVEKSLPPELQPLWQQLTKLQDEVLAKDRNAAVKKADRFIAGANKWARAYAEHETWAEIHLVEAWLRAAVDACNQVIGGAPKASQIKSRKKKWRLAELVPGFFSTKPETPHDE